MYTQIGLNAPHTGKGFSTQLVEDSLGRIGLGHSRPTGSLSIFNTSNSPLASLHIQQSSSDTTNFPTITLRRSTGTPWALAATAGGSLGFIDAETTDSTGVWSASSRIRFASLGGNQAIHFQHNVDSGGLKDWVVFTRNASSHGMVAIGGVTNTPETSGTAPFLSLRNDQYTTAWGFTHYVAGSSTFPIYYMTRSLGSAGSPSDVVSGDVIGKIIGRARSTTFFDTGEIKFEVDGTVTSGQRPPSRIVFSTNASNSAVTEALRIDASQDVLLTGNLKLSTVGKGLYVKEGTNATMGQAVLVGGTVTVNTTKVTANSRIFLSHAVTGGTLGVLCVGTITAATSFVINSASGTDTSTVNWLIVEPA